MLLENQAGCTLIDRFSMPQKLLMRIGWLTSTAVGVVLVHQVDLVEHDEAAPDAAAKIRWVLPWWCCPACAPIAPIPPSFPLASSCPRVL